MIDSVSSSALLGVRSGLRALDRSALQVAQAGTTRPDRLPIEALLEGRQAQRQTEASIRVFQTIDQTLGSLLDVFA
ncbi:hypothetical protein AAG565_10355 [Fontimonas sp. SYSU GA230001]|uniref:hypothetical protein n=1 Tax=Fontimonas sp. SYSU GA230001 TaxID=3142450 RepID=UPI0032B341C7